MTAPTRTASARTKHGAGRQDDAAEPELGEGVRRVETGFGRREKPVRGDAEHVACHRDDQEDRERTAAGTSAGATA